MRFLFISIFHGQVTTLLGHKTTVKGLGLAGSRESLRGSGVTEPAEGERDTARPRGSHAGSGVREARLENDHRVRGVRGNLRGSFEGRDTKAGH